MSCIRKLPLLAVLVLLLQCQKKEPPPAPDVFAQNQKALWIQDHSRLPETDSLFYSERPAPLFRKTFFLKERPKKASLYITAAGYYKVFLNASPLPNNVLDPAWTDFSKRIYYRSYDILSMLHRGNNTWGVALGNGFFNPLPLKMWGRINLRERLPVGNPRFIAKIRVTYQNGETEEFVSDTRWKTRPGPTTKNSVYLGTHYDAQREIQHWNRSDFDDTQWQNARWASPPGGQLQQAFFPPVRVNRTLSPKNINPLPDGKWLVDMGENFTGTYQIKLNGKKGDKIRFRFGERRYQDGGLNPMTSVIGQIKKKGMGGPGAPTIAWQTDSYTFGNHDTVWFRPDFTYHAYRYMEIDGLGYRPQLEDIKGLSIHTAVENQNAFSSSSVLINDIQQMVRNTFLANLVGVQSDCPAREKFGYGGDLNATSPAFIYNFDMQSFYKKTVYDWVDALNDTTFVDTAPNVGIQYCGLSWESAFLITQYQLYLHYDDLEEVKKMYPLNNQWMEKVARLHPEGIVDRGLGDHESLLPVPVALIGTLHYLQSARIMTLFADLMGDPENKEKYQALAGSLEKKLRTTFWEKSIPEKINRQTLFSSLLYHKIIPEDEIEAAKDSLLAALKNAPSGHLTTGIFGTPFALEAISQYISPQKTFDIIHSKNFPGWGHMIDRGATTLWETWKESDNVYSNSHPMFGSVSAWFYRWLGGIRPDPQQPGFASFFLQPFAPKGLDHVNTSYQAPQGKIVSNWYKEANDTHRYEFTIPQNSKAKVKLNKKTNQKIQLLTGNERLDPQDMEGLQDGSFTLKSGSYIIRVSPAQ